MFDSRYFRIYNVICGNFISDLLGLLLYSSSVVKTGLGKFEIVTRSDALC